MIMIDEQFFYLLIQIKDELEDETILPPKQPTFDRSMKPTVKAEPILRSFSPEHGSYGDIGACGLKNLGNTCYMNSIIQCLMNIIGLNQHLKNGAYEKYLNRCVINIEYIRRHIAFKLTHCIALDIQAK